MHIPSCMPVSAHDSHSTSTSFSKAQKSLAELEMLSSSNQGENLYWPITVGKDHQSKDVVFIATRWIVKPPKKGSTVQRLRSRTLTSVYDGMPEDVVLPVEIVGKCVRYMLDASKIIKDAFSEASSHIKSGKPSVIFIVETDAICCVVILEWFDTATGIESDGDEEFYTIQDGMIAV
ncbi:hypothetical protein L1987_69330 [Smallanthus sonchifolius]|uniref:Uncharacterized protein n=1 Tax=Smallanthus sonchifolius TaxID=185202 RepID=A0ACB9B5X1_9ASTR|nr:hypothetical protein L1987_69330 [Smallanthus sonchifolius]